MIEINKKTEETIFNFPYFGSGNGHRYNGCKINIYFTNAPNKQQISTIIKLAPKPLKPKKEYFLGNLMLADGSSSFNHKIQDIYSKTKSTTEDPEALVAFELEVDNWFVAVHQFCPITFVYRVENRRAYGKHSLWHQKSIDFIPELVANLIKKEEIFKLADIQKQWFTTVLKGIFEFGNTNFDSLPVPFVNYFFSEPNESENEEDFDRSKFTSDVENELEKANQDETNKEYTEKTVTGNVFKIERISINYDLNKTIKYKKEVSNCEVYLLKNSNDSSNREIKVSAKKAFFQITLTNQEQNDYQFIEVVSGDYNKIISMNWITQKPMDIILECATGIAKPAIYLYPVTAQEIVVEHYFKGKILNTYPKYDQNWTVIAQPNGVLLHVADNRKYNYLFWDGTYTFPESHYNYKTGFYIEREKTVEFLLEKLSKVGLNETEINDFVVYWLPQLNKNACNFVHFWINDNIDNCSILTITPKPQTSIRLFMEFEKYNHDTKKLPEQELPTFQRKGFTMVEWGGGLIPSDKIE